MLNAIIALGIAGLVFGAMLALAAEKFKVEQDPRMLEILNVLPGANCGACGFPGCSGLAEAIARGEAPANACVPGGKAAAEAISKIMNVDVAESMSEVAVVYCQGHEHNAEISAQYHGVTSCKGANMLGGHKSCASGCLGFGDCVKACPFGAMYMSEEGLPVVIKEKCTGCGACAKACPRGIIDLVPPDKDVHILCRSFDKGPSVRKYCKVGCIACQLCVRSCPQEAISMDKGTLAKIDYSLCDNCGICATKCPTGAIRDESAVRREEVSA